jgi:hypothetical protein
MMDIGEVDGNVDWKPPLRVRGAQGHGECGRQHVQVLQQALARTASKMD